MPLLVSTPVAILVALGGFGLGVLAVQVWRATAQRPSAAADVVPEPLEDAVQQTDPQNWAGDPRIDRALGALPLGVVVAGPGGDVIYRNRYAEQFEGARHGNALVEAELRTVIAATDAGRALERSIEIYGPPARSLQLRGTPTYEQDEQTGSVVLIEDVTLAQHVDRVRKDFVANVSHELRTPIGAIGVLAETLRDADDPEVIDRLAGRLQNEALRLGDMIEDLLALSTLEAGEISEPDLMDLHQVVQLAAEREAGAAEQREVTITRVAGEGGAGPTFVDGDQGQMVSAVANLLDNAVKYSGVGSEVIVTVGRSGRQATLSVTDTGVGIPEADLDRIFERFYRVDDARSRVTGGTGLGLSIVRHVAINHQGSIGVTSEEGVGSTFTLSLPLSTVHTSESAAAAGAALGTPGGAVPGTNDEESSSE
ncbi:MAG: ATP-binding protein [Actinomycetota bacterium]